MSHSLLRSACAAVLMTVALAPPAFANPTAVPEASFDSLAHKAVAELIDAEPRDWSKPVTIAVTINIKDTPSADSWHAAMNRDWSGHFKKRWGKELDPNRPPGKPWVDHYYPPMNSVPEASSLAMMLAGGAVLVWIARRSAARRS